MPTNQPLADTTSRSTDPVVRLAVAGTTAANPRELWQCAAQFLSESGAGGWVRIRFTSEYASGTVEAGTTAGSSSSSRTTEYGSSGCHVEVTGPDTTEFEPDRIQPFIETGCALAQLVGRRARLEHERRLGSFIVELSKWMLAASADPIAILRQTLEQTMSLTQGDGAFVIVASGGSVPMVLGSVGACQIDPAELVKALRPAVDFVLASDEPLLIGGGDGQADLLQPEILTQFPAGMFVPLETPDRFRMTNAGRAVGVLGVVRSDGVPGVPDPFTADDVSCVEVVSYHIAAGIELTQAISKARQAAQRAGAMVDRTPLPLALLSNRGIVLRINDAIAKLMGIGDKNAALGRPVWSFPLVVNGGNWEDAMETIHSGVPWQARIEIHRPGDIRYCEGVVTPLADGDKPNVLLALRDRTDEIRAQTQLASREKLAAVGELASGVAHEVNNPLTTIRFEAEVLGEVSNDPETGDAVRTIIKEVDRAARIAKGLLRLSSRSAAAVTEFDLNDLLRDVVEIRCRFVEARGICLQANLASDLPRVSGVPGDIQQVFVNLIGNAEHAVADTPGDRTIQVETCTVDGQPRVTVSDSGSGVDPKLRTRIFEPFFTTKDPEVGTGLGLALSSRIVAENGGRIWVEDGPLGGAAFVVELPPTTPPL